MFIKIYKELKHILGNEDGFIFTTLAAVAAVGSLVSANSAANNEMAAMAADAKLQRARNERARVSQTDAFVSNSQRAREATQKREIAIESNRISAESKIDETFAGSGISGTSIDELDNELNAAVVKNKAENLDSLDKELSKQTKNYADKIEDIDLDTENINTTTPNRDIVGEISGAVSAGVSAYDGLSGSKSLNKLVGKSLAF